MPADLNTVNVSKILLTQVKQSFHLWVQTELSLSQRKMCCELSKLKGEEAEEEAAEASSSLSALQVRLPFFSFRFRSQHVCFLESFVPEPWAYLWLPVIVVKGITVVASAWRTCLCTESSILTSRGRTARSVFALKSSTCGSSSTPGGRRAVSRFNDYGEEI